MKKIKMMTQNKIAEKISLYLVIKNVMYGKNGEKNAFNVKTLRFEQKQVYSCVFIICRKKGC